MSKQWPSTSEVPAESTAQLERSAEIRTTPLTDPSLEPSREAGTPPRLRSGTRLANRFTVVRFLARGGMGEVYEAWDDSLRTRVALKTILPEFASNAEALERFRREVLLARRVSHPNVCRIHDLSSAETEGGAIHFLTMEFLDGQTLSGHLRTRGRLAPAEVLPLLRQIAAALDAAHAERVVHRDFKSSNVMLVAREGSDEPRAVVTDFGIARAHRAGELGSEVSGSRALGTPEFMAPEQVTGGEVGPAADIYALGIVLYEMLTGHTPFGGGTPFQVALRRVRERPRPPRENVPELDPRWNEAVLRCLEMEPAHRFGQAGELVHFLETGIRPPRRRVRPRSVIPVVLGVVALVAAVGLLLRQRPRETSAAGFRPRPVAAIGGLAAAEDLGTDSWVPPALGQLLELEIAARPSALRLVDARYVGEARKSLGLGPDSALDPAGRERLQAVTGTQLLLAGSVRRGGSPGQLVVVIDSGGAEPTVSESFATTDLLGAASRIGERLRTRLGISLRDEERAMLDARRPRSSEATRLFAQGVARLVAEDLPQAERLFAAASAVDGSFHAAVLAEAETWFEIGNLRQARNAAQRAKELSRQLSVWEQRESEIVLARALEDEGTARVQQKALYADWPDDPKLADALIDAASTVEEGQAVVRRWREAAPGAFSFAVEWGEATLLARAQGPPAADPAFDHLEERARALGASGELGTTQLGRAMIFARSDLSRALLHVRRAQETYRRGGFLRGLALAKNYEAAYLRDKGGQLVPLEESLAMYRRLGLRTAVCNTLSLMGFASLYQGDVLRARARVSELEEEFRAREASPSSWALGLRAWVDWTEGNLSEARRSLQEMRRQASAEADQTSHQGMPNLEGMILIEEDRLLEAVAVLEQGQQRFAAVGHLDYEWKCAVLACRAACQGANPREGLACLSRIENTRVKDENWVQPLVEADCQLEAGDQDKAREAIARAARFGESFGANHGNLELLRGRLELLEGRPLLAVNRLRPVAVEARRRHWIGLALETELALGRAELTARLPGGQRRLADLEEEAGRRGYLRIRRRAATALADARSPR